MSKKKDHKNEYNKENNKEEKEEVDLEQAKSKEDIKNEALEQSEVNSENENQKEVEQKSEQNDKSDISDELKKKDEEIAKIKDQLMRNMAEYDNYRKRTAKERVELEPEITAKVVTEFLAVADSLERAISIDCADENFKKGVHMIYDSFMDTLGKLGVEQIPAEGEFNPSMHQAVQQIPAEEGKESGLIAATFQKGYKIGNKVLRFAMVSVYA